MEIEILNRISNMRAIQILESQGVRQSRSLYNKVMKDS